MQLVNIDHFDWSGKITSSLDPEVECYRIGGLLSKSVIQNIISSTALNIILQTECSRPQKEGLGRGYLFWIFSAEGRKVYITSTIVKTNKFSTVNIFHKLFYSLDDRSLKILLPMINPSYMEQIVKSELPFFQRICHIVKSEDSKVFKRLQVILLQNVKQKHGAGLKKLFHIMTDQQIEDWLLGDLRKGLLVDKPRKATYFQTEEEALRVIGRKILTEDLARVWSIMGECYSSKRLHDRGLPILEGIMNRGYVQDPFLSELFQDIESRSENLITRYVDNQMIDHMICSATPGLSELKTEFLTGNPFDNWKASSTRF